MSTSGNGHGNGKGKGHGKVLAFHKKEDPIKKFVELDEKVDKILNTITGEHSRAFLKAAEEHLTDDEGLIDYDRLKKDENKDKFVDAMADHYLTSVKKHLKIEGGPKKEDILRSDMLLYGMYHTTRAQLKQAIQQTHEQGDQYTLRHHERYREGLVQEVGGRLRGSAAMHLKGEHKEALVKYAKAQDFLDHGKMRLEDAIGVARKYRTEGAVTPKEYEARHYFKKKEAHHEEAEHKEAA